MLINTITPGQREAFRRECCEIYVQRNPGLDEKIKKALMDGDTAIGMTADQARLVMGLPRDINRTVGNFGVQEQWVYGGCLSSGCITKYLYFQNGILNSWQD